MPKRVQIALAVVVVAVLAMLGWQILRFREPVYQGKELTVWLEQFGANRWGRGNRELGSQAEAAIRHIGTNAVPILLERMARRESSIRIQLTSRIPNRWLNRFHLAGVNEYCRRVSECRRLGAYGFAALGPDAKPAVPALIALLSDKHPD